MKRTFSLYILMGFALFSGCSKDLLKSYKKRIIGIWRITDVDRIGIGGSTSNLPFTEGSFDFHENGTLTFINAANVNYKGTWEIVKKERNDQTIQTLQLNAIDFANQQVLSEYYDDINFTGTDRFKATIYSGTNTYVTDFRR